MFKNLSIDSWLAGRWIDSAHLPSPKEIGSLSQLTAEARTRIELEETRAEMEFHQQVIGVADPRTEEGEHTLIELCNRLATRVLRAWFDALKILLISPDAIRRLLYLILVNVAIRIYSERCRDFISHETDENAETRFLYAVIEAQKMLIERCYATALSIEEAYLSSYLKTDVQPREPVERLKVLGGSHDDEDRPGPGESEVRERPNKTIKRLLDDVRRQRFPRLSKERFAEKMGVERSVFFDLQAGRPVSDRTYATVAEFTGISIELLKSAKPTEPTD